MSLDAVVVGSGPNGLTAAVTLARAGLSVRVCEAAATVGGGARTEELTLPGFRHDPCSAVHPLGAGSPAFARFPLQRHGLEWVHPQLPVAHPFPSGEAAILAGNVETTAASLGADAGTYRRLVAPFVDRWPALAEDVLRAQTSGPPRHPSVFARFAARAGWPMPVLTGLFRTPLARGLLAGMAGHVMAPLSNPGTAGIALLFAVSGHSVGWPFPRGGSQAVSDALAAYLRSLGGETWTGWPVRSWRDLPPARAYLLDVSPHALLDLAGHRLPGRYRRALGRYRYGPGVFKIDYALDGPVPWSSPECTRAGTVHLGASQGEIGAALRSASVGRTPDPPFMITAQPSVVDPSRAPVGRHVFWVYAHVPNGWDGDLTTVVERRIEQFAPGFGDRVLARAVRGPREIAAANPNLVGGDIGCGSFAGAQGLLRPVARPVPYATPDPRVFLCSSATPPGPGVHGMCGYHAARAALRRRFHS